MSQLKYVLTISLRKLSCKTAINLLSSNINFMQLKRSGNKRSVNLLCVVLRGWQISISVWEFEQQCELYSELCRVLSKTHISYSRWNFVAITYTNWDIRYSGYMPPFSHLLWYRTVLTFVPPYLLKWDHLLPYSPSNAVYNPIPLPIPKSSSHVWCTIDIAGIVAILWFVVYSATLCTILLLLLLLLLLFLILF